MFAYSLSHLLTFWILGLNFGAYDQFFVPLIYKETLFPGRAE